jgi:hypothetical protein
VLQHPCAAAEEHPDEIHEARRGPRVGQSRALRERPAAEQLACERIRHPDHESAVDGDDALVEAGEEAAQLRLLGLQRRE